MFLYIVFTPISTTSGLWTTGNTRKYQQIDVYIYQCEDYINDNYTMFSACTFKLCCIYGGVQRRFASNCQCQLTFGRKSL